MMAIDRGGTNFGTTALCRVPRGQRAASQRDEPSVQTGCVSCATCDARFGGPIWWNTPLEGGDDAEDGGAAWEPVGGHGGASGGGGLLPPSAGLLPGGLLPPGAPPSRKRDAPDDDDDDDDEIDDDVRKRLAALKEAPE